MARAMKKTLHQKSIASNDAEELFAQLAKHLAPYLATAAAPVEYSTNSLPPDIRSRAGFNRLCAIGSVQNARKQGRIWICDAADWRAFRSTSKRSRVVEAPPPAKSEPRSIDDQVADELGLTGSK
jgi:hypothetical protein